MGDFRSLHFSHTELLFPLLYKCIDLKFLVYTLYFWKIHTGLKSFFGFFFNPKRLVCNIGQNHLEGSTWDASPTTSVIRLSNMGMLGLSHPPGWFNNLKNFLLKNISRLIDINITLVNRFIWRQFDDYHKLSNNR